MDGREIRLKRLFGDGRAVIIAMDHCMFDGPIPGLEDLPATAEKINPTVDAVLLAPGTVRHCAKIFANHKRPLVVNRLNWSTIYCFEWGLKQADTVTAYTVEDSLREGMDIALISLILQTGDEKRDTANVENFCKLTTQCHKLGIPVIGECFPVGFDDMSPEDFHESVRVGTRIIAELGADAIKTFNTHDFKAVTSSCPVPVLGLGAEKLPTQLEALELAASEIADGAAGVVFGRNAFQVSDPHAFQAALCEVVRDDVAPKAAADKYKLTD